MNRAKGNSNLADNCTHPAPLEIFELGAESLEALSYMVSQGRFELPTFPLGGGCSIQLSYWDKLTTACTAAAQRTACMLTASPAFVML